MRLDSLVLIPQERRSTTVVIHRKGAPMVDIASAPLEAGASSKHIDLEAS